jgi:hypothetical protein
MKDQRLIALITKQQMAALHRIRKKHKVSLAEVVRQAIDAYVSKQEAEEKE